MSANKNPTYSGQTKNEKGNYCDDSFQIVEIEKLLADVCEKNTDSLTDYKIIAEAEQEDEQIEKFRRSSPTKLKQLVIDAIEKQQLKTIKQLQHEYAARVQKLKSGLNIFTSKDEVTTLKSVSDQELNQFYPTLEAKIEYLRISLSTYLPDTVHDVHKHSDKFIHELNNAKDAEYISEKKYNKWINRLTSERWMWYEKRTFIRETFPKFVENWKQNGANRQRVLEKAKAANIPVHSVKELAAIAPNGTYADVRFTKKKELVSVASAALNARIKETDHQLTTVRSRLNNLASEGILAKPKVAVWLARVFNDKHSFEDIKAFLGAGTDSLEDLTIRWRKARQEFNDLSTHKNSTHLHAPSLVSPNAFLQMSYPARLAYIKATTATLDSLNQVKENLFSTVQTELERGDMASALHVLEQLPRAEFTSSNYTTYYTYKQHILLQLQESDLSNALPEEQTEVDAMNEALEELGSHSRPYQSAMKSAMACGYEATIALMSTISNGKLAAQKQKFRAQQLKEARASSNESAEESDMLDILLEPLNILSLNSESAASIVGKCDDNKLNRDYTSSTMVVIDGVDPSAVPYIERLHERITAGMRAA